MAGATQIETNEEKRLEAVRSLELMDTEPEDRFDRICRLVQEILGVPVAYIALVDDQRQFFKAECGMGIKQTPIAGTFCEFTINRPGSVLILDAGTHPDWENSPYVKGPPHVQFYLGFPLFIKDGLAVGTMCALDFEPRTNVCKNKMSLLNDLARIAETELTLTILMSDLRGFTPMSDKLGPEKVVKILNHYLHHMVDIVLKWGGTIDEIIGDALLIIFGAPVKMKDHAKRAASCAIEMQQAMKGLNEVLKSEGLVEIQMGIGLNTGEVVVGNIGSEKRMKYSVVGGPVNLTARIEAFTIGGQILASKATCDQLGPEARLDGKLRVNMKGYSRPVAIYEVGGLGELQLPNLEE